MQLLGVYDENLVMPMAQVLSNLGVTRGMVVCGGGMDEASLIGENKVCEIRDGRLIDQPLAGSRMGHIGELLRGDTQFLCKDFPVAGCLV